MLVACKNNFNTFSLFKVIHLLKHHSALSLRGTRGNTPETWTKKQKHQCILPLRKKWLDSRIGSQTPRSVLLWATDKTLRDASIFFRSSEKWCIYSIEEHVRDADFEMTFPRLTNRFSIKDSSSENYWIFPRLGIKGGLRFYLASHCSKKSTYRLSARVKLSKHLKRQRDISTPLAQTIKPCETDE